MTNALDARPRLQEGVKLVRREHAAGVQYVVKLPAEGKYFQFGESEARLLQLMDGRRSCEQVAGAALDEHGLAVSAGQVADFVHRLKRLGVVERTPSEKHLMLMERMRGQRKIRSRRRSQGSLLRLRFSIGDPDEWFNRMLGPLRWMWTPGFVAFSAAMFVVYTIIVVARWDEVWGGTAALYTLNGITVADLVTVYLVTLVIGAIHEIGHGLTTKAFGGEVHEIGAMMLYFSPALFCNTNDAWTFERRSHRLWVTFAGPWIEVFLTAVAAVVWIMTEPGTFPNRIAFLTVLVGGFAAVLANLNPFIPLDGYYALSDWLEISNLRRRSFEYWGWLMRRYALGMDVVEPRATPREKRVFLAYGGLAAAYSVFLMAVSLLWLILVIGRFIGPWVWLIVGFIGLKVILQLSGRARSIAAAAAATWRSAFHGRHRRLVIAGGSLFLIVGLPFIVPWTFRARGDLTVASVPRIQIRAEVEGILDGLHVREGDLVQAGQPIATLWNPDLMDELSRLHSRAARLRVDRASAEARGDLSAAGTATALLRETEKELSISRARAARVHVRSPIRGVVLGQRISERIGERLDDGDLIVEVASPELRQVRIRVRQSQFGLVEEGQTARFKLRARPDLKYISPVTSVAPAAEDGWLLVEVPIPGDGWMPSPGMTGTAKIILWRGTVAEAIGRAFRQTVRTDLWL